jgi:cyclase
VEIEPTELTKGLHVLHGAGGNIGVLSGEDGVFMIDDQFAPLTEKILMAGRTISDKPIRFRLNPHWHFDHTDGNENMASKTDVNLVAHDNVRSTMAVPQELKAFKRKIPASPKVALPVLTYADAITLHLNGETVEIRHLPSAHTDGDSFVYFHKANVIHAGDTFFNGFYAFIDVEHSGRVVGIIQAAETMLAMGDDNTRVIPGHGPMGNKAQLQAFRDMLMSIRELVRTAKERNENVDQVLESAAFKAIDAKWGGGFLKGPVFMKLVFPST